MSDDHDDRDYDVGYGKPPRRTQFKKGQSGNPKGRPKGAKGVIASLKREMESKITIQEGGRSVTVSRAEAVSKRLMASALTGDMKAMMAVLKIDSDLYGDPNLDLSEPGAAAPALSPEEVDFDILRDFFQQSAGDGDDQTIEDWEIDDWNTDTEAQEDDGH